MSIRDFNIFDELNTPAEEAYRVLRTNLQFSALDKDLKTIAVTSTYAGEGKTTTAVNLAISMAKVGKKVLYVDADMRKGISAKDIFERVAAGLSNFLSRMDDFDSVVYETNISNLYVVPCGIRPPNPAELLNTRMFEEFLREAGERFDVVILDTPPLGSVIDCAIVANHADGVILVVKRKTADCNKILRVKQQLEKANARILGVVLNKIGKSDYKSYYKYYDYHNKKKLKRLGIKSGKFGK
ncbi:MAG: CpsD/CapB family tyrosine-protein kinase [Bacillota bacterium]